MQAIVDSLAASPLLHLALAVGLGSLLGRVPFGRVRLGAAAVLFAAIGVTALGAAHGARIEIPAIVGDLGLALFAFAIGLTSGPSFFSAVRRDWPRMLAVAAVLVLVGLGALGLGGLLGLDRATIAGAYAGALSNTPALAAAGGSPEATVGYSVAYLGGVVIVLIAIDRALARGRADRDAPSQLRQKSVAVDRGDRPRLGDVLREHGDEVTAARLQDAPEGSQRVAADDDVLQPGAIVSIVGPDAALDEIARDLGHTAPITLPASRRDLEFRRITVSRAELAGRPIRELDLEHRLDATISRVRRGDVDMVGTASTVLQLGDRVRVVAPSRRMPEVTEFFGDSSRGLTDLNPVALGLGLLAAIALGQIAVPLPGGGSFSLGIALAALLVGLVFGRLGRIGPMVTTLPYTAATVLTELGLMVFLAYAGTRAGGQILTAFSSDAWWRILILGTAITLAMALAGGLAMRLLFRQGGTRTAGLLAGMQTQPALLAYASGHTGDDARVLVGYALAYPVAMLAKIVMAGILAAG